MWVNITRPYTSELLTDVRSLLYRNCKKLHETLRDLIFGARGMDKLLIGIINVNFVKTAFNPGETSRFNMR